jgi:prevent-host-death family protein
VKITILVSSMSETISAAEANRQFSRILRAVEAGESFTITSHGRPVAHICPVGESDQEVQARRSAALTRLLEHLRQQQPMNLGKWTREELYER